MYELPWLLHAWAKLSSWPGLPTEANSYRDTCYLLWEGFALVLAGGVEMSRVSSWEIMGSLCFQGMSRLTQGVLQKGMVLGPWHHLHLRNEEGHFLLVFLLLLDSFDTFYSKWSMISLLFWLNNCMKGQGTETETSWPFDKSNILS